eukprot:6181484-Pleurochrysis_carterae.AAC.8
MVVAGSWRFARQLAPTCGFALTRSPKSVAREELALDAGLKREPAVRLELRVGPLQHVARAVRQRLALELQVARNPPDLKRRIGPRVFHGAYIQTHRGSALKRKN